MNEIVILVPARGGSKRLPDKNLKRLARKSLIRRTAEFIREGARGIPVYLSTDSPAIAEEAVLEGWKVPFLRPTYLATDQSSSVDVALHFLDHLAQEAIKPRILILLQLTSPFRHPDLLRETIKQMISNPSLPAIVSMKDLTRTAESVFTMDQNGRAKALSSDQKNLLTPNGALYAIQVGVFKESQTFTPDGLLPILLNEIESIDIDTTFDWAVAELMASYWDKNND